MTGRWIVCALVLVWAAPAHADSRVGVAAFEGPQAGKARGALVAALEKEGATVVGGDEIEDAAGGESLSTDQARADVARKLELAALCEGQVQKRGRQLQVRIRCYDGASGQELASVSTRTRPQQLVRRVRAMFADELRDALLRASPVEAEPEPEPTPEPEPLAEEEPRREPVAEAEPEPADEPEEPTGPLPDAFELGLGVRVQVRDFAYNDPLIELPEHSLDPTPAFRFALRFYPAALATDSFAANLGIVAHAQVMWPVEVTGAGTTFETTQQAFGAGVRVRIPLGAESGSEFGVQVGYSLSGLEVADSSAGDDPGVPSVSYGGLQLGLDGRIASSESIALDVAAAYLVLMSFGEVGERAYYPHASGGGLEAELALAVALAGPLGLRVGGGVTRYFLSLEPRPDDPGVVGSARIAGGAVDQTLYGTLGLQLRL